MWPEQRLVKLVNVDLSAKFQILSQLDTDVILVSNE